MATVQYKFYKIKKSFQGGLSVYFAKMSPRKRLPKDCVDYQLEEWGDGTSGGHAYGYRITMTRIKSMPKLKRYKVPMFVNGKSTLVKKWRVKIRLYEDHYSYEPLKFLKFNEDYLERCK